MVSNRNEAVKAQIDKFTKRENLRKEAFASWNKAIMEGTEPIEAAHAALKIAAHFLEKDVDNRIRKALSEIFGKSVEVVVDVEQTPASKRPTRAELPPQQHRSVDFVPLSTVTITNGVQHFRDRRPSPKTLRVITWAVLFCLLCLICLIPTLVLTSFALVWVMSELTSATELAVFIAWLFPFIGLFGGLWAAGKIYEDTVSSTDSGTVTTTDSPTPATEVHVSVQTPRP